MLRVVNNTVKTTDYLTERNIKVIEFYVTSKEDFKTINYIFKNGNEELIVYFDKITKKVTDYSINNKSNCTLKLG